MGVAISRAYFEQSIDARLATRLTTLQDDAREKKITEATTIETTLGMMEDLYLDVKPLWVQRLEFFKAVQGTNESFEDCCWARKTVIKENFKLQNRGP